MKKLLFIVLAGLIAVACNNPNTGNKEKAVDTETNSELVEESGDIAKVEIDDLIANPENYLGQTVSVKGLCVHVCQHGGKRMFLQGEASEDRFKIETGEDLAAFNTEMEGSVVSVVGTIEEMRIDEQYLVDWENEVAAEYSGEEHEDQIHESDHHIHTGEEGHEDDDRAQIMEKIKNYRDEMKELGVDHLSFYSMLANSFEQEK